MTTTGWTSCTRVNNVSLPGEGPESGLCHLRRLPDFTWTDWELLEPVKGGFNQFIAPVLAYGGGGEGLNLFAVAADNTVWHSVATKDGWSEWLSLEDPGAPVTGLSAVVDAVRPAQPLRRPRGQRLYHAPPGGPGRRVVAVDGRAPL